MHPFYRALACVWLDVLGAAFATCGIVHGEDWVPLASLGLLLVLWTSFSRDWPRLRAYLAK